MNTLRNYLTTDELEIRLGITIAAEDEDDYLQKIGLAEQQIDAYVGYQERFLRTEYKGEVSGATGNTIFDQGAGSQLGAVDDYFAAMVVEVIGGTGAGQARRITGSSREDQSIDFEGGVFNPALSGTSAFKIYQLGKFPRRKDASQNRAGTIWYKSIPEAVKAAVAAQVEFIVAQGADYFTGDKSDYNAERIGNYSYQKGGSNQGSVASSVVKLMGPKAKALLNGIRNITGKLSAGQESWL